MSINTIKFGAVEDQDDADKSALSIWNDCGRKPGQLHGIVSMQSVGTSKLGKQNISIGGNVPPSATFVNISGNSGDDWMRWRQDGLKTEIKMSDSWFKIDLESFKNTHPLDFARGLDLEGKEDLLNIKEQYKKQIESSPQLQKLREEFNDLLEKHKLITAIKGNQDA